MPCSSKYFPQSGWSLSLASRQEENITTRRQADNVKIRIYNNGLIAPWLPDSYRDLPVDNIAEFWANVQKIESLNHDQKPLTPKGGPDTPDP